MFTFVERRYIVYTVTHLAITLRLLRCMSQWESRDYFNWFLLSVMRIGWLLSYKLVPVCQLKFRINTLKASIMWTLPPAWVYYIHVAVKLFFIDVSGGCIIDERCFVSMKKQKKKRKIKRGPIYLLLSLCCSPVLIVWLLLCVKDQYGSFLAGVMASLSFSLLP